MEKGKTIIVVLVLMSIIVLSYSCYKTVFKKNFSIENVEFVDSPSE